MRTSASQYQLLVEYMERYVPTLINICYVLVIQVHFEQNKTMQSFFVYRVFRFKWLDKVGMWLRVTLFYQCLQTW